MSHARISSGVGVRPTPYPGDCASAQTPMSDTNRSVLRARCKTRAEGKGLRAGRRLPADVPRSALSPKPLALISQLALRVPIGHAPISRDSPRLNRVVQSRNAERLVERLVEVLGDLCSRGL